jgi:hypothetical protein
MQNIGEEIAGEYLKFVKGCEFIEYNLYTPDVQGEIDVIGINMKERSVYICEVAIHLITGLQYTRNKAPDNVNRFLNKFRKNIPYAERYFAEYKKHFMLWSPIVKNPGIKAKHNQTNDVLEIQSQLRQEFSYDLELVINEHYQSAIDQLRAIAGKETKELKSPVLRMLQIEEKLKKHINRKSL